MRVVIFGASGGTGRELVSQAIARGWNVKAQVRRMDASVVWDPRVDLQIGDPQDPIFVQQLLAGVDAVIIALGISRKTRSPFSPLVSPANLTSKSVATILAAMKEHGVSRIVYVSAFGAADSWQKIPGWGRLFIRLSNVRYSISDHTRSENLLAASAVLWTVLRPMMLEEVGRDGSARRMQPGDSLLAKVSKAALAKFALDAVHDPKTHCAAVPVTRSM
jgi:uncharacterized protein YbjT (DUF2867 family)